MYLTPLKKNTAITTDSSYSVVEALKTCWSFHAVMEEGEVTLLWDLFPGSGSRRRLITVARNKIKLEREHAVPRDVAPWLLSGASPSKNCHKMSSVGAVLEI